MPMLVDAPRLPIASGMPRMVVWPIASCSARPLQILRLARVMIKDAEVARIRI
jgi:hypothetical protein